MARPKSKTVMFSLRMTAPEFEKLVEMARAKDTTISEVVRKKVFGGRHGNRPDRIRVRR